MQSKGAYAMLIKTDMTRGTAKPIVLSDGSGTLTAVEAKPIREQHTVYDTKTLHP